MATTSFVDKETHIVSAWLNDIDAFRYDELVSVATGGALGDDSTDDTVDIQADLTAHTYVYFVPGKTYKITDELILRDGQQVFIPASTTIKQYTADKAAFKATSKTGVVIWNDGIIHGAGIYLGAGDVGAWTGNTAHQERGVHLRGCTRCAVVGAGSIRNFGHAQVAILGGSNILIQQTLEGTHAYGKAIVAQDNFQMGVYLSDDDVYLGCDQIDIDCNISGVTQGVVRENVQALTTNYGSLKIRGNIHDVPGQHAVYVQSGDLDADYIASDIESSACKLQTPIALQTGSNFRCRVIAKDCGSHLFEVASLLSSVLSNAHLVGQCERMGGSGISLLVNATGSMNSIYADIEADAVDYGFDCAGPNFTDVYVRVRAREVQLDGILITATTSSNIHIWPTIRNPGLTASHSGITVSSASADVHLHDPDVTDANTNMVYGLDNNVAGGIVRVHGSATFTGSSAEAVRNTGNAAGTTGILEWPTVSTLSGVASGGAGTSSEVVGINYPKSSSPVIFHHTTTASGALPGWGITLADESAYLIKAEIVGKYAASAERAAYVATVLAYRNGATAALQGAEDVDVSIVSASFAPAAYTWVADSTEIYLKFNSGATQVVDWTARMTVTKIVD